MFLHLQENEFMCRFQRVDQEARRRKATAPQMVDIGRPVSLVTGQSPLVILGDALGTPLDPLHHHHPLLPDAPHMQSVQHQHTSANVVWSTITRSTALALTASPRMRTGVRVPFPLPLRPPHLPL